MTQISMIIPAAGRSSRHPGKLLKDIGGITAIERTVASFVEYDIDLLVVLGNESVAIESLLRKSFTDRLQFVHNPNYEEGLSTSIIAGLKAIQSPFNYIGFCSGDKPFIDCNTIDKLLEYLDLDHPLLLLPTYDTVPGHPSFFHHSLLDMLLDLEGDIGGSQLFAQLADQALTVPVPDRGVILDMDMYLDESIV